MPRYYSYIDTSVGLGDTIHADMVSNGAQYGVVPSIDIVARNITATGAFIGTLGNDNSLFENIVVTGIATIGIVTGATYYGDGANLTGIGSFSGNYNDLSNKPTIPTNNNQLTNGAGFITDTVTGNLSVSGNVSVGGTLTYEDVTNIDSIGIITARNGIQVTGGNSTFAGNITAAGDVQVGNNPASSSANNGLMLRASGGVIARRANATDNVFAGYLNGSAEDKVTITAGGNITAAGDIQGGGNPRLIPDILIGFIIPANREKLQAAVGG